MPRSTLGATDAHLWWVRQDEIDDSGLLDRYRELLSPDEAAQHRRFVRAEVRHEYLVTRALCRSTLSRYVDVDPASWKFVRNQHGRPEILSSADVPPLRFNLSNTTGMIVCLVTSAADVGVDVEDMSRQRQTMSVADRFFASAEVAALRALPAVRQRDRFFDLWTLKESYIKARGKGLALPLGQFSFHLGDTGAIAIEFGPEIGDNPEQWHFSLRRLSEHHVVATAIRSGEVAPRIEVRRCVPLRDP